MPELPEVQTVVNHLHPAITGFKIVTVKTPNEYKPVLENGLIDKYINFLKDKKILSVIRRGKYIVFNLNNGYLLIHLRMTGKILLKKPIKKNMKYVSFQLCFSNGKNLYFEDIRKFGRVYICKSLNWLEKKIGIEPLSDKFTPEWLFKQLSNHKRMIKPLLLDQKIIAGLGNIYVDESLWEAGIHPKSNSNTINQIQTKRLQSSIKNILNKAIKYQGTTIINYSFGQNKKGNFTNELQIFGKHKTPCPKCNLLIIKEFIAQRGTHYCNNCQKL